MPDLAGTWRGGTLTTVNEPDDEKDETEKDEEIDAWRASNLQERKTEMTKRSDSNDLTDTDFNNFKEKVKQEAEDADLMQTVSKQGYVLANIEYEPEDTPCEII